MTLGRLTLPLAVIAVYTVFGVTWAITNPPFAAPDETQHYIRALGIRTDVTLAGPRIAYTGPFMSTERATEWRRKLTRAATVPPLMSPEGLDCETFQPDVTPRCADSVIPNPATIVQDTDVGSYPPLPYLLPAAATALGDEATSAARWGRLASLLLWLALISSAVWMLWDRRTGGVSLVGLVIALTPTAVFIGSSLNNSGIEIAASIAFFSALLRLSRDLDDGRRAGWGVAALSGAILVLSRSLGFVWLACGLAIFALLAGRVQLRATVVRHTSGVMTVGGVLTIAVALAASWELAYGPRVGVMLLPSLPALHDGVSQLRYALEAVVGKFGYEDVRLGTIGFLLWATMAVALVVMAARFANQRERWTLLLASSTMVVVPVYIYAAVTSHQGISTQGRHLLPLAIIMPLLSAEILRRHANEYNRGWWVALLPVHSAMAVSIQLWAWLVNSHRYAVGAHGPWWFHTHADWSPPGGWTSWSILVTGVTVLVSLVAAFVMLRAFRYRSRTRASA